MYRILIQYIGLMLLHRLAMSNFQAIKKPKSTPEPVMVNDLSDPSAIHATGSASLLALEECVSTLMQGSSSQAKPRNKKNRNFPMVVVPAMSLEASRSSELSPSLQNPNKKRNAMKGTPKALREQPLRAVKLMPTIEYSATPSSTNTTPMRSAGAESDSNWSFATTHLGELESDMSPEISHRRTSRHRLSSTVFTGRASTEARSTSSSHQEISGKAVKREGSQSLDQSLIRLRTPSPLSYSKEVREKKLREEAIVELSPAEWAHQRLLMIEKERIVMKRLWKEEVRKQKGKEPEYALGEEALTPCKVPCKRKVEPDPETNEAPKRQKMSHKTVNEDMHGGLQPAQTAASRSEHPFLNSRGHQSGKYVRSGRKPKVTMDEGSERKAIVSQNANEESVGAVAKGSKTTQLRDSDKTMRLQENTATLCIPTGPKAQQAGPTQIPRSGQQATERREVELAGSHPGRCKCKDLPNYFKQARLLEPSLADFGGGPAELLAHIRQIGDCKGHNQRLVDTCRLILNQEQASQWVC